VRTARGCSDTPPEAAQSRCVFLVQYHNHNTAALALCGCLMRATGYCTYPTACGANEAISSTTRQNIEKVYFTNNIGTMSQSQGSKNIQI
ncbi:unnamed protein product, partial [Ceratitis capitata]